MTTKQKSGCDLRVAINSKHDGALYKFDLNEREFVYVCNDCLRQLVQQAMFVPLFNPFPEEMAQ